MQTLNSTLTAQHSFLCTLCSQKKFYKMYPLFNHTFLFESQKHFFCKLSMQRSGVQSKSTWPFFLSQSWHARFQSSWLHHRSVSIELLPVVKNRLTSENNSQFILMSRKHFTTTLLKTNLHSKMLLNWKFAQWQKRLTKPSRVNVINEKQGQPDLSPYERGYRKPLMWMFYYLTPALSQPPDVSLTAHLWECLTRPNTQDSSQWCVKRDRLHYLASHTFKKRQVSRTSLWDE